MKNTQTPDADALASRVAFLESQLGLSAVAQAAAVAELEAEIQERQLQAQELYAETRRQGANVESHRLAVLEAEKAHRLAARDASNAENRWRLHVDETRRLQAELDVLKAQQAGAVGRLEAPIVRSIPHAPHPTK